MSVRKIPDPKMDRTEKGPIRHKLYNNLTSTGKLRRAPKEGTLLLKKNCSSHKKCNCVLFNSNILDGGSVTLVEQGLPPRAVDDPRTQEVHDLAQVIEATGTRGWIMPIAVFRSPSVRKHGHNSIWRGRVCPRLDRFRSLTLDRLQKLTPISCSKIVSMGYQAFHPCTGKNLLGLPAMGRPGRQGAKKTRAEAEMEIKITIETNLKRSGLTGQPGGAIGP